MPNIAIAFGAALIILGIVGFLPHRAPTALIPSYVGAAIAICGLVALKPNLRKHAMHAAAMIATLAFIATAWRLIVALLRGGAPSTLALIAQIGTALITGVFVVLCIQSFIAARRAREAST